MDNTNMDNLHYQDRLDELFANGGLWKHRTFRTIFDPYSSEYSETTYDQKLEYLAKYINSGLSLSDLIDEYKEFYIEENKPHVVNSLEDGLLRIITKSLSKRKE